jgi:adenylate cyclase
MRLFHKLLLLLSVCAAVPVLVLGTAGLWRSHELGRSLLDEAVSTGEASVETGRRALFDESRKLHIQVVERRARELEDFFERGRELVAMQSVVAKRALTGKAPSEAPPLHSDAEMAALRKDAAYMRKKPYALYKLAPGVSRASVSEPLARLAALGDYYAYAHIETPWLKSLYTAHPEGFVVGYPGFSPFPAKYDARSRPWYEKAVRKGRVTWSSIYADKDGRPVITCAEPILDGEKLLGVSAADVAMEDFLDRLFELSELPATDALLANFRGQVRISATAKSGGRFEYRSQPAEDSPHVGGFMGGLFERAFDASLNRKSGTILVDKNGVPIERAVDAPDGSLLAYAQVFIRTRKEGKHWYLLVRTPLARIAGPAEQVSASLSELQGRFREAVDAQASSMGIGLAAVAAAALLIALFASWKGAAALSRPLAELTEAVRSVGRGELDIRLEPKGDDEIAEVGRAVNEMAKGLKEGLFVKQTFKRYLAASVVDRILEDPSALDLGGEERELTVFFSDMSGFTELSEQLDPKSLVGLINEYLGAMTDSIFLQEGTLDKYEGDAVMAFWGAPIAQDDHARRACWAALDNRSRLKEMCARWEKEKRPTFDIRIGVNTGMMVVGNIGSKDHLDYTVLGDAVNLGSRLEQANKIYGTHILISERTREEAGGAIEAREIDRIAVKGKKEAVVAYELLGLAGQVTARKREGYDAYEAGLAAYRQQDWDGAETSFRAAISILGGDKAASVLLQRALVFRRHPPGENWDGAFRVGG